MAAVVPPQPPQPALTNVSVHVTPAGASDPFDNLVQQLSNATNPTETKDAKEALKTRFGIDIDKMKISKPGDPKSAHKVTIFAARVGKAEGEEVAINTLLPSDADKAKFLYAQHKIFFPVLAKQSTPYVYGAVANYEVERAPTGGAQFKLQDLTIEKYKPGPNFPGIMPWNWFGWASNLARFETWKPNHIQALPSDNQAIGGDMFTQSSHYLADASRGLGLMTTSEASEQIYAPGIMLARNDRARSRDPGMRTFRQMHTDYTTGAGTAPPLPPPSMKLLEKLSHAEDQPNNRLTDKELEELLDAIDDCQEMEWSPLKDPDYNADRSGNTAKIQDLAEHIKRFGDYCQAPTRQPVLKQLRAEFDNASKGHSDFMKLDGQLVQFNADFDAEIARINTAADLQNTVLTPNGKTVLSELDESQLNLALQAQKRLLMDLRKKEQEAQPYFKMPALKTSYEEAQGNFHAARDAAFPLNTTGIHNFGGLVTPDELNQKLNGLAVLPVHDFSTQERALQDAKQRLEANIQALQAEIVAQRAAPSIV